ncbi:MAG: GNAT family protein [Azospirillaceae bacterium]
MIGSRRDWADAVLPDAKDRLIGLLRAGMVTAPQLRLDTQRLYLRPPRMKDWKAWAGIRQTSRAFLTPWEPTWPTDAFSRRTFMRRLRRQIADWRADRGYALLIFDRSTEDLMGGVNLTAVRRGVAQVASLGYWVGEAFANRGIMTEAVKAVLTFGFRQIGLHRIEAACLPHNEPSQRLLTRVGFSEEGFARNYLRINGQWQDHVLFGLVREDFDRFDQPHPVISTGDD